MKRSDKVRLLRGPYTPPALKRGDRATCLYLDSDVIITSWTDGRIAWPRCRRIGQRSHPSLLVDEELARAIRSESALALQYWFGVSDSLVTKWRQALGVPALNEGSRTLRNALNAELGAELKGKKLPAEAIERRRQTARQLGLRPPNGYGGSRPWTAKELRVLGTMPDEDLAARLGRSTVAVRVQRTKQGIPKIDNGCAPFWSEADLALLGAMPDADLAARLGRTVGAVRQMRTSLGIQRFLDKRRKQMN